MVRMRTPGPGAYEVPDHLTMAVEPTEVPKHGTSQFASRSRRSHLCNGTGDPGAYDTGASPGVHKGGKETLGARSARSFNRNVGSGGYSFQSRSPARSSTPPPRSARGGPGYIRPRGATQHESRPLAPASPLARYSPATIALTL